MPAKVQCFWDLWGPRGTLTWWLNPAKKKRDESYVIVSNPKTTLHIHGKRKTAGLGGHRIDLWIMGWMHFLTLNDNVLIDKLANSELEENRDRSFKTIDWNPNKIKQISIYTHESGGYPKRTVFHNQYSYLKTTIVQFVTSHVNWAIEKTITTYTGGTWKSCWLGMWNLFPPSLAQPKDHEIKAWTLPFFSYTKYVTPKSLKAGHWLSEIWAIDENHKPGSIPTDSSNTKPWAQRIHFSMDLLLDIPALSFQGCNMA